MHKNRLTSRTNQFGRIFFHTASQTEGARNFLLTNTPDPGRVNATVPFLPPETSTKPEPVEGRLSIQPY
jgi:hypothetical protein